jgi:anti-sigma factor RsiW
MTRRLTEAAVRKAWAALAPASPPVMATGGMTRRELASCWAVSQATVKRQVQQLVESGQLRQIGVRPGSAHAPVYDMPKNGNPL